MEVDAFPTASTASVAAIIRERRHALQLTQEDLAQKCHLHRTFIGQVERGDQIQIYQI